MSRERIVTVVGNPEGIALGEAITRAERILKGMNLPPQYSYVFTGQAKTLGETGYYFLVAFTLSITFMYLILAAQFESWMQPIAILMALPVTIPFGMLSLVMFHTPMDLYAMFGLFMLVGIVKKNGILQVDATNQLRAKGHVAARCDHRGQPHAAAADPDDHRDAGRGHGPDRAGQRPGRRRAGQHGQGDHRRPDALARAGPPGHARLLRLARHVRQLHPPPGHSLFGRTDASRRDLASHPSSVERQCRRHRNGSRSGPFVRLKRLIEGKLMSNARVLAGLTLLIAVIGSYVSASEHGESPAAGDTLVIRLVHPDRQAATVLKLFDGARAPHPAAALSAWKRATRSPNQLGKPLEAVIAVFNPEMAREWRVMHDAELCLDLGSSDGKARWYAIVPRDDGTLSAAVTAMRLTNGAADAPLTNEGEEIAVERLGPAGTTVSARAGDALILGGTHEELRRGLHRILAVTPQFAADTSQPENRHISAIPSLGNRVDSGLIFELDPGRMNANAGTTTNRRAAVLLQGLGCRWMSGNLALKDDVLALEVMTLLGAGSHRNRCRRQSRLPSIRRGSPGCPLET